MKITGIHIGGFANIESAMVHDVASCAFVAPNNYGKSNVLAAISFGVRFIQTDENEKLVMMRGDSQKPINNAIEGQPFSFSFEGMAEVDGVENAFLYEYSFVWADDGTPGYINRELLKAKQTNDSKYKILINRTESDVFEYVPSPTGRCNKKHVASGNNLAINLLGNNYELFMSPMLRAISSITIPYLDTLDNPNIYFSTDTRSGLALLEGQTISEWMYKLKTKDADRYSLLKSAILQLLRSIDSFEPTEVVLGEGLANKIYDIRIKERQNSHATSIRQLSSGSKRVIFILSMCVVADIKGIPMMMLEEPENSIHPRLLQNLLSCMRGLAEETKMVFTSHSTHIMRYFDPERLYLGLPNKEGLAEFARLKPGKVKTIYRRANEMDITFGEYMYEMLLDMEDDESVATDFFQK